MNECIVIGPGDTFTVEKDIDGYLAVKIQNTAFVEEPRWIVAPGSGYDHTQRLHDLIQALTELRDRTKDPN